MSKTKEFTIGEWMKNFRCLYEDVDKNRTPEQLWIATMAHCSTAGEAIRKFHFGELIDSMAHVFCWMCSFVNKCNVLAEINSHNLFSYKGGLSDMVSAKYPNVCGHCLQSTCQCKPIKIDSKSHKSAKYKDLYEQHKKSFNHDKQSIHNWVDIFYRIYGQNIHIQSFESIGFHFLEEAGECASSIRNLSELNDNYYTRISNGDTKFLDKLTDYKALLNEYCNFEEKQPIPKPNDKKYKEFFTSRNIEIIESRIVHAKMDMIIEMADTFSWFCSIWSKATTIRDTNNNPLECATIDTKLKEIYMDENGNFVCPTCSKQKCICSFSKENDLKNKVEKI